MVERNLRGRMEREKGDGSNLKTLVKEKIVGGRNGDVSTEVYIYTFPHRRESKSNGAVSEADSGSQRPSNKDNLLRDILYLGVAYAANIGGTGSLTGTNPNLVLVGFLQL